MSATTANTTQVNGVWYVRVAKRPNRIAVAWVWWLETLCQLTGHAGGCLLLNSFRVGGFGNLWHRQWVWANRAADDMTWWEPA